MEIRLTPEDEYALEAFGISREEFIAVRQKEVERRRKFEPAATASRAKAPSADPDGLSEGDIYALEACGISREDFLAARKKEKERGS